MGRFDTTAMKERIVASTKPRPPRPPRTRPASTKRFKPRAAAAAATTAAPAAVSAAPPADATELAELRAQRDRLIEKFTIMEADLGGAFYEMAIRDHVRLDVLTRKAAELQRVDAELSSVERALELERTGAAGLCNSCGTAYSHGTRFCSQCGSSVEASRAA
jgi:hypothetical protein